MSRYHAIAEFYDDEHADTPMLQEDVPFFLGQLPTRRQSILELCVGTARAAIPLAQAGHRVCGIDYDPVLLQLATCKRESVGLKPAELELIEANALTLNLGRSFDWVCIFFNTLLAFTTVEEQDQLLQVARNHLKPGGRLWVDIFNPDLAILSKPIAIGVDPHLFHVPSLGITVQQSTDLRQHPAGQLTEVTFHYTWFDRRGVRRRRRNRFGLTWMFEREVRLLMDRNGFDVEDTCGNYDGSGVTDGSPRIIARCRRR